MELQHFIKKKVERKNLTKNSIKLIFPHKFGHFNAITNFLMTCIAKKIILPFSAILTLEIPSNEPQILFFIYSEACSVIFWLKNFRLMASGELCDRLKIWSSHRLKYGGHWSCRRH